MTEEQKCQCGVRPASQCTGAWEQGCDLGANEEHVKVGPPSALVDSLRKEYPSAGGSPEHLLQDLDRGLSRWFSGRLDARKNVDDAVKAITTVRQITDENLLLRSVIDKACMAFASICLAQHDSTSSDTEKARSMAGTARDALDAIKAALQPAGAPGSGQ